MSRELQTVNQQNKLALWAGRIRECQNSDHAERSIKPFVIDRKNFLFTNTPKGATESASMFSLIQTAIENSLDPYRYLTRLIKTANNADLKYDQTLQLCFPGTYRPNVKQNNPRQRRSREQSRKRRCCCAGTAIIHTYRYQI